MPKDASPNGGASPRRPVGPRRVSEMQAKLHRWAVADPGRRFDDLFNFVYDPATLIMAFDRVAGNRGARTPGVDGLRVADIEDGPAARLFLRLANGRHGGEPSTEQHKQDRCGQRPAGRPHASPSIVPSISDPLFHLST